jgi:adiponectin receptor
MGSALKQRSLAATNGYIANGVAEEEEVTFVVPVTGHDWKLISYEMLPHWMKDNHYIQDGYRPPLGSMSACWWSVLRLHTETGNIWTHLIGFVLFFLLWASHMIKLEHLTDQLILSCFFVGATICLGLSTAYHTCSCHSRPVHRYFHKLDYCGISTLILGSFIPTIYYSFYSNYFLKWFYLSAISILTVIAIVVSLFEKFGTPQYRSLRAAVFLTSGLSGVVPGIHWFIGYLEPEIMWSFYCLVTQGALYVVGALLYAMRIPERWFPGRCDYYFQSHQFFHTLVVIAALVHLNGLQYLINYRLSTNL